MKTLSRTDQRKIKDAYADGLTQEELALIFGVSQSAISKVLKHNHTSKEDQIADRMERFLGGACRDDGCYHDVQCTKPTPNSEVDNNDPLSVLLAEEEIKERLK